MRLTSRRQFTLGAVGTDLQRRSVQSILDEYFPPGYVAIAKARFDGRIFRNLFEVRLGDQEYVFRVSNSVEDRLTSVPDTPHLQPQLARRIGSPPDAPWAILRPRFDYVLSDMSDDELDRALGVADSPNHALEARWKILEAVLTGTSSLRQAEVSADLRPSNIGFNGSREEWAVGDWGLIEPEPTPVRGATDVHPHSRPDGYDRFRELVQRLLGNYLWDSRDLPNIEGIDAHSFEWVLDFVASSDSAESPTTLEIVDALVGIRPALSKSTFDLAHDQVYRRARRLEGGNTVAAHVMSRISKNPETALSCLRPDAVRLLMRHFATSATGPQRHNRRQLMSDYERKGWLVTKFETGIDDEWRSSLHESHFGYPLDLDHEKRMKAADSGGVEMPGRVEYLAHIRELDAVRAELLNRTPMLHSESVVSIIRQSQADFSLSELQALRRWGDVLAVRDHGRWLYPAFQFDGNGVPFYAIREVRSELNYAPDRWTELAWWSSPRRSLGSRALADVLHTKSGRTAVARTLARHAVARLAV